MLDFLFLKYETTVIATMIGATIGFFILIAVKNAVKSVSDKHPLKLIGKICYEIKLSISVTLDWIKGFDYYSIAEYPDYHTLQMGSVIKVEDRKYPERHNILSSDGTVRQLAMVLSVGYVHHQKEWCTIRVRDRKHT